MGKNITLLPADSYTIINKTILTHHDKDNLISLYSPIIGPIAISLYLSLWRDLDKLELVSIDFTHHHLMTILKSNLEDIKKSRESLEAVGLLKTYYKEGSINHYVYELYSPLSPYEFFNHPVFNILLYNNIGKKEYDLLKKNYTEPKIDLKEFIDISKLMDETFKSISYSQYELENEGIKDVTKRQIQYKKGLDFDLIKSSLPKGLVNNRTFNKKTKELINNLAFIYNIDALKMTEILRMVMNEHGFIEKEHLRKSVRNYYQFNNNGSLPTLIHRTQPEYLKAPTGDGSNRGKMLFVFENTSPYDFLKNKYRGTNPTNRDKKLLETLVIDLNMKPAVVNVLIDYVLRINNNKLNQAYVETIAGQWKRIGIETANDAMQIAEKEHKKIKKKMDVNEKKAKTPVWFDKNLEKEAATDEELKEMENLLKEFR